MTDGAATRALAIITVGTHYGLTIDQVKNLEVVLFRVMLRHVARARPCDHPGGTLAATK